MTEDEAKTKWCPFVRLVVADRDGRNASTVAANRLAVRDTDDFKLPVASVCIGSACMAWRWDATWDRNREVQAGPDFAARAAAAKPGFCGLAGRPMEASR